ncbi:hypothetical protein IKQ19_13885 [Candidatus Saccharibacteria bacterium]|nr:hypothetical protein [Candidatus Saccharibacteria bacterium]
MAVDYSFFCENCRKAETIWKFSKKTLNDCIRRKKIQEAKYQTRIMALLYCTVAEAYFLKIVHTPGKLAENEIGEIMQTAKNGISNAWKKCLEIGLDKCLTEDQAHVPNVKSDVEKLIDQYVFDPAEIRNKIAHGQWENAFNRDSTAVNLTITRKIEELDIAALEKNKFALVELAQIMTDILVSPNKAHIRDYGKCIRELEDELRRRSDWSIETKQSKLKARRI